MSKPLIIAQLLATVGTLVVTNEQVVAMGRRGFSIYEKSNGGGVVWKTFGRKVVVRKEEGKWKVKWVRN